MSGGSSTGMFWGKKISEIDIWRKPGQKPKENGSGMRLSPHPDPTANEAIANVMRAEQEKRKRQLRKAIEDEREQRRILEEKRKDGKQQKDGEEENGA